MASVKGDPLAGWCRHGLLREGKYSSSGDEYETECPFCLGSAFHLNPLKHVYHCKTCGEGGNFSKFLEKVHTDNKTYLKDQHMAALSEDRGLPIDALRALDVGWDTRQQLFTIPVRDISGRMIGLDMYKTGPDTKIYHTSDPAKVGIYNAEKLIEHMNGPIYICEGIWDALAMELLLKDAKKPGLVIGIAGAMFNIIPYNDQLLDREVILLFDHDFAGRTGEFKTYKALEGVSRSTAMLHWPKEKKKGYDIRDHVIKWSIKNNNPKKGYDLIHSWLYNIPREYREQNQTKINLMGEVGPERRLEELKPVKFWKVVEAYQDLLYMPDITPIRVLLGTIFANRYRSEMVWMFLVAPPACGKSELIMSLSGCHEEVENISSVTERTLISGFIGEGGKDVSLLPKLNNRNMAVKDFTPLMQGHPDTQQQVFGILRDVYDGSATKAYGNNTTRTYKGIHFGIVGGVTSVVETFGRMQQSLGERFLRYYIPVKEKYRQKIKEKANANIALDKQKRAHLYTTVHSFVGLEKELLLPTRSLKIRDMIDKLAEFTVILRTIVPRDFKERMIYMPMREGSTRVFKQMSALAMGMARLERKEAVGLEEINILKDVALSTCPDIVKRIIDALHKSKLPMSLFQLEEATRFPVMTLKYQIDDLRILQLVTRIGVGTNIYYELSPKSKELIAAAEIYKDSTKKRFFIGA